VPGRADKAMHTTTTTTTTTTTDTAILDWIGLDEARHIATECAAAHHRPPQ
jgi:hypothetical protein